MDRPTRHLLLRDRRHWLGAPQGLDSGRDGVLTLSRVPAPARAIDQGDGLPHAREVSGIATRPNGALFIADTAQHRVVFIDGTCNERFVLPMAAAPGAAPGQFNAPRGLALGRDALLVADSGNARVQHLALPALEPHLAWGGWADPIGVAVDSRERVLVIDAGGGTLSRLDRFGAPDAAFDAAVAAAGLLVAPRWVAVAPDDSLRVSDIGVDRVFAFDSAGAVLHELAGPPGWLPGALACVGDRVHVADAATGAILAFDAQGVLVGTLPNWHGPVTAMAAAADGGLAVKPGLDDAYHLFDANAAFVAGGTLAAGPFDAGEAVDWERVWLDADVPEGCTCRVEAAALAAALPGPAAADWVRLPSADALLAVAGVGAATKRRFLWLQLQLATERPDRSPRVRQLRAATAAEDLLDHLPFTYRRNDLTEDGRRGGLSRLLALLRGEFGAIEESIDALARLADADFHAGGDLPWLASWLALELPAIRSDDERRALIERAVALFDRRGTPASIAGFVELHTGIRPTIVEGFSGRQIWVLGVNGRLDFETQLPPLDPLGWVAPDPVLATACCPVDGGEAAPDDSCGCGSADGVADDAAAIVSPEPAIGRIVVGGSGPLAAHQIGVPLFAEDAHAFCVLVDAYRLCHPGTLDELRRIVDREKPAHTDYRVELLMPDLRVGLQARVGVDTIVGGDPAGWRLAATLGIDTRLNPSDPATRIGDALLGEGLTLN